MIGHLDLTQKQCAVIGGGIAGLLAAYRLVRSGFHVDLYEAAPRLGGLIQTVETPFGIAERAAHSLLVSREVEELFYELKLERLHVNPASQSRFILRNKKLRRFPLNIAEVVQTVGRAIRVKAQYYENLGQWGAAHLGQPAVDYLLSPFILGVYGSSVEELSVQAAFPKLEIPEGQTLLAHCIALAKRRTEPRKKSQKSNMQTLRGGMQGLTDALVRELQASGACVIHLNQKLEMIPHSPNVIISVPAREAARLVERESPGLSSVLQQVHYAPLVSCTVFVERSRLKIPDGIGVLMPPKENRKILGILFNSSSFKGRVVDSGTVSCTVMMGGTLNPEYVDFSDDEIQAVIKNEVKELFSFTGDFLHAEISRYAGAIPIYSQAILDVQTEAQKWAQQKGRILFGNYTGQVSIRGMIEASQRWMTQQMQRPTVRAETQ